MRGIFPVAIKAARILGVDPDLCTSWTEVLDNLAPHPTNALPDSPRTRGAAYLELWIAGLPPVIRGNIAALNLVPAHSYDLCTTNTEDKKMLSIAAATFDASYPQGINADTPVSELDGDGTVAANLGRREAMRYFLVNQIRNVWGKCPEPEASFAGAPPSILANRMTLREGPGAIGVERLGRMSEALHAALLQSGPARPGGDPILGCLSGMAQGLGYAVQAGSPRRIPGYIFLEGLARWSSSKCIRVRDATVNCAIPGEQAPWLSTETEGKKTMRLARFCSSPHKRKTL